MTQAEIAKKYGITQSAVSLWKKSGCNLNDPAAVERFADMKAARSRGITRKRKLSHIDKVHDTDNEDPAVLSPEYREVLAGSPSDAFVDLPGCFHDSDSLNSWRAW